MLLVIKFEGLLNSASLSALYSIFKLQRLCDKTKKKTRNIVTADRLLEDKKYLLFLSNNVANKTYSGDEDGIWKDLSSEAKQALTFMDVRAEFWQQIQLNNIRQN